MLGLHSSVILKVHPVSFCNHLEETSDKKHKQDSEFPEDKELACTHLMAYDDSIL